MADYSWARLTFGTQHNTYVHLAQQAQALHTRGTTAVLYADQSKAFERLPWHWIHTVFQGWGIP
eukprot:12106020-Prorocentrum_lima.AAC.1